MPVKAVTYNYNYVNDVSIADRHNLKIKLNNHGTRTIKFLMMNPSYADRELADQTTDHVINAVVEYNNKLNIEKDKYQFIEMLNLLPQITPLPSELNELETYQYKYNLQYLYHHLVKSHSDIVFATGNISNSKANRKVKKQMRKTYQCLLKRIAKNSNINLFACGLINRYGGHKSRGNRLDLQLVKVAFNNGVYYLKF